MKQWLTVFSAVVLAVLVAGGGLLMVQRRAAAWNREAAEIELCVMARADVPALDQFAASALLLELQRADACLARAPWFAETGALERRFNQVRADLNQWRIRNGFAALEDAHFTRRP